MISKIKITMTLMALAVMILSCSDEVQSPSGISNLPDQPPTPHGLTASIGDSQIQLAWSVNDPTVVNHYRVYFTDSSANVVDFLDTTSLASFNATGLVNGRNYFFRVAVVDVAGREGLKSRAVGASPGLFAISIANGAAYVNNRNTPIDLTAPSSTGLVQLSEDSLFGDGFWEPYTANKSFDLSDADGMKYIYARFQLTTGGESILFVSDSVTLDRRAVIEAVTFAPDTDSVFVPGDNIHFTILTSETGGTANIEIGALDRIELNDFGLDGDAVADDGIYEADYVVQIGTELTNVEVLGHFTDAAKNGAPEIKATSLLNINSPHQAVVLTGYVISSSKLLLEWTQAEMSDFSSYRLFRSGTAPVDSSSLLVTTVTNQSSLTYNDIDLADDSTYYYRLFVYDDKGNTVGSNALTLATNATDPLEAVVLSGYSISSSELLLEWTRAETSNFSSYRLFRSETVSVDSSSSLVTTVTNQSTLTYSDTELADTQTYYYRLYVFDDKGSLIGSNDVSLTTKASEPVVLTGYPISSRELLLEWTRAELANFSNYRLFRSEADSVNLNSFLVTTATSQSSLTYSDTGLTDNKTYYYRVFVFDDKGNSVGSDSLALTTEINDPPVKPTLAASLSGDTLSVKLSWTESTEADFMSYHVLRDTDIAWGTEQVIGIINHGPTASYLDIVPQAGTYYYKLRVIDIQGSTNESDAVTVIVP